MSWTEERTATLKRLWESGATATEIAKELGEVSRNAVIGKAHRLGLKSRPSPVKTSAKKAAPAPSAANKAPTGKAAAKKPAQARETPSPAPAPAASSSPSPAPAAEPAPAPNAKAAPVSATSGSAAAGPAAQADKADDPAAQSQAETPAPSSPKVVSVGPGGFLRQGPGDQQAPIPPAPPRRLVPAKPSADIAGKTSLLDLSEKVCRWPMGHPGEPDFHFCGAPVNPGFPYCVEHCGRAYQAQLPRGSRRPPPPLPYGGPRVR